jgi:hypothetical protein
MRDLIWTVIGIWLVYKIASLFSSAFSRQKIKGNTGPTVVKDDGHDLKRAVKAHVDREGEYVDFEELR